MGAKKFKVVILGGGTGGLSVAARLNKFCRKSEIAIVEPSEQHYYQPLWTLVGAGLVAKEKTERRQSSLVASGNVLVKAAVERVIADRNEVVLASGETLTYDVLVVATGLRLAWERIEGIEALGRNGVCSIYDYNQVDYAAKCIQEFKGGSAIFTMPPVPIKCAGAPQKIMYLAENVFRNHGVRAQTKISFATAGKAMFGVPVFSEALTKIVKERGIQPLYQHKLVAIDGAKKTATFSVTTEQGTQQVTQAFDLLHVVPPMAAHDYVDQSDLAFKEGDQKGWLAVDKFTLQHVKHANVFGVGDVTGVPNSKTGAAIRKQAPVVVRNIRSVLSGQAPTAKYDGYASCPLVTEIGKVMLAEFGYDGKLMPSFPLDPTVPRRSMWHLKKDFLPVLYWQGMLKGRV